MADEAEYEQARRATWEAEMATEKAFKRWQDAWKRYEKLTTALEQARKKEHEAWEKTMGISGIVAARKEAL